MTIKEPKPIDLGRHKVSPAVFTATFPKGCDFRSCNGSCCEAGVIIGTRERDTILAVKDELIPLLRSEHRDPAKWFSPPDNEDFERLGEEMTEEDKERYVGTGNGKDYCVFFNPEFGCAIQKLAVMKGLHKWSLKPASCILYPLFEDKEGVIRPDANLDGEMWCSKAGNHRTSIFRACAEELKYFIGKEGYAKLEKLEQRRRQGENPP